MENVRCDFDENLWPDQQEPSSILFFMNIILYLCGNIQNMKSTVIGQARFHFTCTTFIQK